MGEIAEMMINGDMDMYTGEYLGPGRGYPRTRHQRQKNPIFGVKNFLQMNGVPNAKKYDYACQVLEALNIEYEKRWIDVAMTIQDNWKAFKKYVIKDVDRPKH
jgi:hypothetical protein